MRPVVFALAVVLGFIASADSLAAQATRGEVLGQVIDDRTGVPISDVRVVLTDDRMRPIRSTITDATGRFRIPDVRAGPFFLRAARLGYRATVTPRWRILGGDVLQVELRMDEEAVLLAPLEIVALRRAQPSSVLDGFRARMASGLGHYITRADIEARQPLVITDMLATVPGVRLESTGSGLRRTVHVGRAGANRCPAQIFVDGFLYNRPTPFGQDQGFVLDDAVTPNAVEGIEVYRGLSGVPAEFLNPSSGCGVVVIWTRRGGPTG